VTDPTFPTSGYEGEPSPLGTAATISKRDKSSGGSEAGRPKRRRPRIKPGFGIVAIAVVVIGLALVPLLGTAFTKTPRDRIGVSYGGGPFEGASFQKVVQPGSGLFFNGFFDALYLYPSDQQAYIVTAVAPEGDQAGDTAELVAPSADRVRITYQVAVYFRLNTDEIRAFHEQWGLKYEAYTEAGWNRLIRDTLRQQVENALQAETRRYEVAQIYGDADLLVQIQESVQDALLERLGAAMGRNYFCAPTFTPGGECDPPVFVIKRADVPESVSAAYERNRTSALDIVTRQNEVQQRIEEAKGIEALSAALAESGTAYVLLRAIESGDIDFWVLPSDGSVDLTAPSGATPAPGG
jgi:hypothetical protein